MATNTCMSTITYQNANDIFIEPFLAERNALAEQMFNEGKTEYYTNAVPPVDSDPARRYWVDHAAAQEFIDFVLLNAPTYNVTITSTGIEDL
jgi:hypothetical protein